MSRLKHPISKPSPQVLKVVIIIVKPRAGRSVCERSSPMSRTPQVYAMTTPIAPSITCMNARPKKIMNRLAGVPKR